VHVSTNGYTHIQEGLAEQIMLPSVVLLDNYGNNNRCHWENNEQLQYSGN
jgi:hypothetical protein